MSPQARSRIAIVWLVPSVIAAMRIALLRKNKPLPEPSLLSPKATSAASLPVQAAYELGATVATVFPSPSVTGNVFPIVN